VGNHRGEVRLHLVGFFEFERLSGCLLIKLRFLDRNTQLVADGLEQVHFLGLKLARRPACKLKSAHNFAIGANRNHDKRFHTFLF
jgi:hypothetical protein